MNRRTDGGRQAGSGREVGDDRLPEVQPTLGARGVEAEPVDTVAVAVTEPPRDGVLFSDDCEGREDLVVDEIAHGLPLTLLGHAVQVGLEFAPAVHVQHRAVGRGGPVEGDLLTHPGGGPGHGLLGLSGDHEARSDELEVSQGPSGLLQAPLHGGDGDLPEVPLGAEGVADQPVADLAGHLAHERSDGGQEHFGRATFVGARVEKGGHEGVSVEVAPEVELRSLVPRRPDGPHRADHLPHAGRRPGPLHGEPLGYVGPDLGAEAEDEAAVGVALEVVAEVRQQHRVPGEGHRD